SRGAARTTVAIEPAGYCAASGEDGADSGEGCVVRVLHKAAPGLAGKGLHKDDWLGGCSIDDDGGIIGDVSVGINLDDCARPDGERATRYVGDVSRDEDARIRGPGGIGGQRAAGDGGPDRVV